MKKIFTFFMCMAFLTSGLWAYSLIYVRPGNVQNVKLMIPAKSTAKKIASILAKDKIIEHPTLFYTYLRLKGISTKLKPGSYTLNQSESFSFLAQQLLKGQITLSRVTFPEGTSLKEMALIFDTTDIISGKDFLKHAMNPELAQKMGIPGVSFEGFLFPNTYLFEPATPAPTILKSMHAEFKKNMALTDQAKAKLLGFNLLQWITLASIIEKESSNLPEQPIISAVFHNRLKKNMRLQTDPTVIYGIKDYDGNITRKHLRTRTPYNTYMNSGLPPGPISNPGLTAIKAAVNPANTPYLYFVAKGRQGEHYFSTTYKQHQNAVNYYQLNKGKAPPAQ